MPKGSVPGRGQRQALARVNRSQLGLYKYIEGLLRVTNYPKMVITTHWDNFRLPYRFSQQEAVAQKLSPQTYVIIPKHLSTIPLE